jgi:hypothetical protein
MGRSVAGLTLAIAIHDAAPLADMIERKDLRPAGRGTKVQV